MHFSFFFKIFYLDHFSKVFIEFLTILLLFCVVVVVLYFGHEAHGIEPQPHSLEGEVRITGLPGKSQE